MTYESILCIVFALIIIALLIRYNHIWRKYHKLKYEYEKNPLNVENERLKFENSNLQRDNEELLEREKATEKAITEALESNPMWGFPEHDAFPGSIAVASKLSVFSDDNMYGIIQGRLVLNSEAEAEFQARKSNSTRLEYILAYIKKLGFMDRIILQLLRSGCIECTFGHNEKENATEVYFQTQLLCPKETIRYDLPSERS